MTQEQAKTVSEIREDAFSRASNSKSIRNWTAVIDGFMQKGIQEDQIKPAGMFGDDEANVFTFHAWKHKGRRVIKRPEYLEEGEKWGVPLVTYINSKRKEIDPRTGEEVETGGKVSKKVYVFHITQTVPLEYETREREKEHAASMPF